MPHILAYFLLSLLLHCSHKKKKKKILSVPLKCMFITPGHRTVTLRLKKMCLLAEDN